MSMCVYVSHFYDVKRKATQKAKLWRQTRLNGEEVQAIKTRNCCQTLNQKGEMNIKPTLLGNLLQTYPIHPDVSYNDTTGFRSN